MEKNQIKIALVDNNKDLCNALSEHINLEDDLDLAGVAHNGITAVELLAEKEIDVLVLDITMPYLDGIGVLEELNKMNLSKRPRIIVITAIEQENMVKKLFNLGIDYYLIKPFNVEVLLERIRQFGGFTLNNTEEHKAANIMKKEQVTTDAQIALIFHEMGVPVNLRGYCYLREAITIMLNDESHNWSVTKNLYPQIAQKFHCTPSGVESAIRYILDTVWQRGNLEYLAHFFNIPDATRQKQPTASHFMSKIVEKLHLQGVTAKREA